MLRRYLLLIGVILAGITMLGTALLAPAIPKHPTPADLSPYGNDFALALHRLNLALRDAWAEAKLEPAAEVNDLAIARRLTLGLAGRIPSLQEIRQFETHEPHERLPRWLADLFKNRRSIDYLAERLARAYVGTEDGPFLVFRRRRFVAWLSDELMRNRPYNEMVREMITSEGMWTDQPSTNFITVTAQQGKDNAPDPERLAGRVARAFLGIHLDCAQCHNHPFESWKQTDFQGIVGFFGQVQTGLRGITDNSSEFKLENRKTGAMETITPRVPFLPELVPQEGSRRHQLAAWITDPKNPYFARVTVNRFWAILFGRPIVAPVDDISSVEDPPALLKILADDFVAHGYDVQRLVRLIVSCDAFRRDSAAPHELTEEHDRVWAAFPLTRLRPEQVAGSVLQAASLETINADSPFLIRLITITSEREFVTRYGDTGEDEFGGRGGTIPQRLLLMNGELVHGRTKDAFFNAATRIGWFASDDAVAVRTAYLTILTRPPTELEAKYFEVRLAKTQGNERAQRMEDLFWTLLNSTEFAWNH